MISQPCRAVYLFSQLALAPEQRPKIVATLIGRGETKKPGFLSSNPLGQVPIYSERGGFVLTQGTSIMRLLADERGAAAHWRGVAKGGGGASPRARAGVDELLDFYHSSMRPHTLAWAYGAAIGPRMGTPPDAAAIDAAIAGTERALKYVARRVAATDGVGDARALTLADLVFACELSQFDLLPAMARGVWLDLLAAQGPGLSRYLAEVHDACGQHWQDAHTVLQKLVHRWAVADGAPS